MAARRAHLQDRWPVERLRPRTGPRTWGDGKLYNPDDGQNYQVSMTIQDDGVLRLRAYVLPPLFGKTRLFTRME